MYKKLLLTSALVAGFASTAAAHPHPTVTLGGHLDTQLGYRDQKPAFETLTVGGTNPVHKFAIVNDTKININVDGKGKNGLKYGGMITLNADTSNNKTNHANGSTFSNSVGYTTMGYVQSKMGRLEAGTTTGAVEAMKVNASSVARATGGVDGDWRFWVNQNSNPAGNKNTLNYVMAPNLPTNADTGGEDKAAKATFYTPMWNGFKAGVSYIPDTEQHGTVALTQGVRKDRVTNTNNDFNNGGYKDVFSGGIHYHAKMKGVKFVLSALGETGSAKNVNATGAKREDLGAFELGGKVHYMGWTFAGSFGDWDKSGTTTGATGKQDAHYWNVGAGYEHGAWGMSVGYFESEKGNGGANRAELQNLSIGVDYKLAPGFMPYAEVSFFDMDLKTGAANTKNSGAVVLAGTKLVF